MSYKKPQHRDVRRVVGVLPKGMCVHHKDGDTSNNAISNLEIMSLVDHARMHTNRRIADPEQRDVLFRWHRSPEGAEQLRVNAEKMRANTPERECTCRHCSEPFVTNHPTKAFCSKRCVYLDRIERQPNRECSICGELFKTIDKRTVTCSYECGWALRRRRSSL